MMQNVVVPVGVSQKLHHLLRGVCSTIKLGVGIAPQSRNAAFENGHQVVLYVATRWRHPKNSMTHKFAHCILARIQSSVQLYDHNLKACLNAYDSLRLCVTFSYLPWLNKILFLLFDIIFLFKLKHVKLFELFMAY